MCNLILLNRKWKKQVCHHKSILTKYFPNYKSSKNQKARLNLFQGRFSENNVLSITDRTDGMY